MSTRWALWRQDDSGRQFLIETYSTQTEAEAARRSYEARGHKQTYWVQAVEQK